MVDNCELSTTSTTVLELRLRMKYIKIIFMIGLCILAGCSVSRSPADRVDLILPRQDEAISKTEGLHIQASIQVEYIIQAVEIEITHRDIGVVQKWRIDNKNTSKTMTINEVLSLPQTIVTGNRYTISIIVLSNQPDTNVEFGYSRSISISP